MEALNLLQVESGTGLLQIDIGPGFGSREGFIQKETNDGHHA